MPGLLSAAAGWVVVEGAEEAASAMSFSCQEARLMSQRFMPQTSEMSIGATFPRKREARKEETSEMRAVRE